MPQIPLDAGFYVSESLPISHQECTNWYVNLPQTNNPLSKASLYGTPGIELLLSTGEFKNANRGAAVKNGVPFFVNGPKLYSVTMNLVDSEEVFSLNELGDIEGDGVVSIATNGKQLMVLVPDGKGYIYDETESVPFVEITDSDFYANGNPQIVKFVDGYFACTTDSKKWIISSLNDGTSWSALDFGSAESDPDVIVSIAVFKNQVFILGSETTEGFQNIGGSGFPFVRSNIFLDKGCAAPYSVVTSGKVFFMIGGGVNEGAAVWLYTGGDYEKVSTAPIDYILQGYTVNELSTATALKYSKDGAIFVGWNLPDRTLFFDLVSRRWHERKSRVFDSLTRWRVSSIVYAYQRLLVGDNIDGRIGILDRSLYTEYGNNITRVVSLSPITNDTREIRVPYLELTMESGSGNDECSDPKVSMSLSKDAKKFGYERIRSIGKVGEFSKRVVWLKNGRFSRFVVIRFTLSDPVNPTVIKLEAR